MAVCRWLIDNAVNQVLKVQWSHERLQAHLIKLKNAVKNYWGQRYGAAVVNFHLCTEQKTYTAAAMQYVGNGAIYFT